MRLVATEEYCVKRRQLAQALLLSVGGASLTTNVPYYAQTRTETTAKVIPVNLAYPFGDLRRYGGDPTGMEDSSHALQSAADVGLILIPPDASFRILTGATRTGRVSVLGSGPTSQLWCDSTVLTVNGGDDSVADNFQLLNITQPWIITRNPVNWESNISRTLRRSNSDGYQPTVNDGDVWSTLTKAQQDQQIGPSILFRGDAMRISVSRIYGRFVQIGMYDTQYSSVCDCNFRGGKGAIAAIHFWNVNGQVGQFNKALRNTVWHSSFSGIVFARNTDFQASENLCVYGGESGIKTWSGTLSGKDLRCYRGQIQNNVCRSNYYDGIDATSNLPPDDQILTYHQIQGNHCDSNGGDGINCSGQFNQITSNYLNRNGRFGLWGTGLSRSKISGNFCVDNNQARVSSQHDLGIVGKADHNMITNNWVWAGTGQNNYGIYAPGTNFVADNYGVGGSKFFFGNPGAITAVLQNNVHDTTDSLTNQAFTLAITNSAGRLQNAFYSEPGQAVLSEYLSRISGAEVAFHDTPDGADASTPMAFGGKIGASKSHVYHCNTAAQSGSRSILMAHVSYNDTGSFVNVQAQLSTDNIAGTTIARLAFVFTVATSGAAFSLNRNNIPPGRTIHVQFIGKLA
jgi:hypothetical protein